MMTYKFGFIIEQTLGHLTHGKNLQTNLAKDDDVVALWGFPTWDTGRLSKILPVYKSNWTVRAGLQARDAVATMKRNARLDALFFHTQVAATLSIDHMGRIPSVVSLDATPLQYDSLGKFYAHQTGTDWIEGWKWRLNKRCFQVAHHLVTWSQWAKDSLISDYGVDDQKITVIPPGINLSEWSRPEPRNGHNESVKILFVGGNLLRKGGHLLIEVFRQLLSEDPVKGWGEKPNIELHLVTKDSVVDRAGVIVQNNMQPNSPALKKLYHDCDICCLPTNGDCLPMVLSEAGAAGLPLVSTDVGAIPEIVRNGETGYIVPVGELGKLKAVLRRLIYNPELRRKQGEQAKNLVRSSFDASDNAKKLLELLKHTALEARNGANRKR